MYLIISVKLGLLQAEFLNFSSFDINCSEVPSFLIIIISVYYYCYLALLNFFCKHGSNEFKFETNVSNLMRFVFSICIFFNSNYFPFPSTCSKEMIYNILIKYNKLTLKIACYSYDLWHGCLYRIIRISQIKIESKKNIAITINKLKQLCFSAFNYIETPISIHPI